jgi:lysyl-tRNA synthetase class 2
VLLAWLVRIAGVVSVFDLLRPQMRHSEGLRFDEIAAVVEITSAVLSVVAALLLAGNLARRRRRAWRVITVLAAVGVLAHLRDGSRIGLATNAVLLVLLLVYHREFRARSLRSSRWLALRVLATSLLVSLGAGLVVTHHLAPKAGFGQLLVATGTGLFGATPDLPFRHRHGLGFSSDLLSTLGLFSLLVSLLAFLAPVAGRRRMSGADEARLRALLEQSGAADSLGYFGLRRDKVAVFSPSGKAAVVYRVLGAVSLASGDPLGDPEAWPGAISAWLAEADSFAWIPGVLGASETGAAAYGRAGLDAFELGDEAVLDLTTWRLDGRAMRGVRQAVNRARRAGYTVEVDRQRDLAPAAVTELSRAAEQWRDGEVERGFSMALGRLGDPADPDLLLVRVRDAAGVLAAVLAFVPWGSDGVSLDLMRRAPEADNVVELAVATVAGRAESLGLRRLSLNFAVFRAALERGARIGAGPVSRLSRQVLLLGSRWWQIDSLYRANAKYQPQWVPRFVCFRGTVDLPRVSLAALEAEAFVQRPRLLRVLGR